MCFSRALGGPPSCIFLVSSSSFIIISPICLAFSLYSSEDGSIIEGKTDIALAWCGGQCVAMPRNASLTGRVAAWQFLVVRHFESLRAVREVRIVAILLIKMPQLQRQDVEISHEDEVLTLLTISWKCRRFGNSRLNGGKLTPPRMRGMRMLDRGRGFRLYLDRPW